MVVRPKITDLDLASLKGVDDKPSILGVFLNYGDMIVRSRERKHVGLKRLADPDAFRNAIAGSRQGNLAVMRWAAAEVLAATRSFAVF
jgi:hypothetical protein